jgi:hypothetical protein
MDVTAINTDDHASQSRGHDGGGCPAGVQERCAAFVIVPGYMMKEFNTGVPRSPVMPPLPCAG